jgi:acetolactate synthase-1/3 small subunit
MSGSATAAAAGEVVPEAEAGPRRHVVSALVVDRPGTLNRVSGLLRARSFNIESLTVGTTHEPGHSRMTIAVRGDDAHLRQVLAQLERLIEVLEVCDLTTAPRLEYELALVEIDPPRTAADGETLDAVLAAAGGETLSTDATAWHLRLTATPDRIDDALDALRGHGLRNLVRAGAVAMSTDGTTGAANGSNTSNPSTNGATNG